MKRTSSSVVRRTITNLIAYLFATIILVGAVEVSPLVPVLATENSTTTNGVARLAKPGEKGDARIVANDAYTRDIDVGYVAFAPYVARGWDTSGSIYTSQKTEYDIFGNVVVNIVTTSEVKSWIAYWTYGSIDDDIDKLKIVEITRNSTPHKNEDVAGMSNWYMGTVNYTNCVGVMVEFYHDSNFSDKNPFGGTNYFRKLYRFSVVGKGEEYIANDTDPSISSPSPPSTPPSALLKVEYNQKEAERAALYALLAYAETRVVSKAWLANQILAEPLGKKESSADWKKQYNDTLTKYYKTADNEDWTFYDSELTANKGFPSFVHDVLKDNGSDIPAALQARLVYDGFEKITSFNYDDREKHNISSNLAYREVTNGEYELAVILRGTDTDEWYGNMDIGDPKTHILGERHYSFEKANQLLQTTISQYLTLHKGILADKTVNIFIAGHSRGAAVGNLLAVDLKSGKYKPSVKNVKSVVAYTFATPNNTTKATSTDSIFNFCFEDDFVPQVPLSKEKWGYGKSGELYSVTAELLYLNNPVFAKNENGYTSVSYTGNPSFDSKATNQVLLDIGTIAPTKEEYYSKPLWTKIAGVKNYDEYPTYLYEKMNQIAAAKLMKIYGLSSTFNDSWLNESNEFQPIARFFLNHSVGAMTKGAIGDTVIRDTHSMYTYYNALKCGGFSVFMGGRSNKTGDKMGDVLHSDIVASINGSSLSSYNIGGNLVVVVSDLSNYGFNISYDNAKRTSSVTINPNKVFTPLKVEPNTQKPGTVAFPYVYTDIKCYVEGKEVQSWNIQGKLVIKFSDLATYGNISFDNVTRSSKLTIKKSDNPTPKPPQSTTAPQKFTISGKVTDGKTAINNATVVINLAGDYIPVSMVKTDSSGNYSFVGINKGTYTMTASKTGYSSETTDKIVVSADISNNFVLKAGNNVGDSKKLYEVFELSMTWKEAKAYCEKLDGHLATITSQQEQTQIEGLIKTGNKNYYWLGATDEWKEGVWQWITGEAFVYKNWASAQPDNAYGGENYLAINRSVVNSKFGQWNDLRNEAGAVEADFALKNAGFICEWATSSPSTPMPTPSPSLNSIGAGNNATNMGYVAMKDNWIYYRNPADGSLCKSRSNGTELLVIDKTPASYINVVGDWIHNKYRKWLWHI